MIGTSMSAAGRAWRSGRSDWRLYSLSVFSLAVSFVCLTTSLLVVVNLHAVRERWTRAGRASIYLRDETSKDALSQLEAALQQTHGVAKSRYISAEEARKEVLADGLGGSLAELPNDAFPSSIELELLPDIDDQALLVTATKLRALPMVESVETYDRWTERLSSMLRGGVTASAVLAVVVLGAVVTVISSTMRLALHRRRTEVEVMKLVGATDAFVRGPFVLEGAAQGALGALSALAALGALFVFARGRIDGELAQLLGINPVFLPWEWTLAMILAGGIMGAFAAFTGIRRHLLV